eukprot:GHVT01009699.1.p1 GENE.GHVT01009699.1~~GHVT01009699.1.p1  ORF type:complete len:274 (+),score=70.63 GHVT01009699.1:83-823(+)
MKDCKKNLQAVQSFGPGTILDLRDLHQRIGGLQVFEAFAVHTQRHPLNKFVPVQFDQEERSKCFLVLCVNQLIVLTKQSPEAAGGGVACTSASSVDCPPSPPDSSASAGSNWQGNWLARVRNLQASAKDLQQAAVARLGNQEAPPVSTTANGIRAAGSSADVQVGILNVQEASSSDVLCFRVEVNHRLQSLAGVAFLEGRNDRLRFEFKGGHTTVYELHAATAFVRALQAKLSSLLIGLHIEAPSP